MTLLQKVAFIVNMTTGDGGSYEDSFLNLVYKLELPKTYGDNDPEIMEDLDFENFGFLKVEDDEIVFSVGGDWQKPLTITIKLNEFNDIYVAESKEGFTDDHRIKFHDVIQKIITSCILPISSTLPGETGSRVLLK